MPCCRDVIVFERGMQPEKIAEFRELFRNSSVTIISWFCGSTDNFGYICEPEVGIAIATDRIREILALQAIAVVVVQCRRGK